MIVAVRPPFGQTRVVYAGDAHADRVTKLDVDRRLDRAFATAHLDGVGAHDRTILAGVRAVPPGHALLQTEHGLTTQPAPVEPRRADLRLLLEASVARAMQGRRAAVALSGGLDSAIVLALARQIDPHVPSYVVAPRIAGYSELEAARRAAQRELRVVEVTAKELVAALPPSLMVVEEPLYNLHPVSRLLLGRALREDGIEVVLTGDGVDQVSTRDESADYLPLVHALTAASGVDVAAPFLDETVVAHLLTLPASADKPAIRVLGDALGIARAPKRSQLCPPLELNTLASDAALAALAHSLGRPLDLATDRARVRWTSLALLVRQLELAI